MMDTETNLLFVYGTLLSQAQDSMGAPMRVRLAQEGSLVGPAIIDGRLLDFGPYPGLIVDQCSVGQAFGQVHGEVVALYDPKHTFVWLDEYEGIDSNRPYANEYERARRCVELEGSRVTAWVYLHINTSPSDHTIIESGRWLPRPDGA